ncbi:amidohydrolase family protein [Curtobacterium flaccumfaciens]|uniref:Amidohydrolase family protein n=1 Tax=Curtobacterium poinsettiae TaxID=159612 RepID=A0A9Q9P9B8_9MICO|nr:amidohydrolase family protein [Curtobacterium flaccumfaciens]UXN26757.1 amidohydrolase family protein [Curtobacterium flaccumfaciens]UYC81600.1 amidohydrolase family protein [Curtobacterium flaccumfaciens pv. poinsettiae]
MTPPSIHPPLLVRDVRLVDGTGGSALDHVDVEVAGDRIAGVTPTGSTSIAATAGADRLRIVDGRGRTLLPGFVDCHVHLTTSPTTTTLDAITEPESAKTLRAVPHLAATLRAGVTTVRDLAGADAGFRDAVEHGVVSGPRLLVAIRILSVTGGHGDSRTIGGLPLDDGPGAGAVGDGPDAFLRLTREVVREGADWVKVAATGGVGSPRSHPEGGGLREAEMRTVVQEVDRHGLAGVAAHAIGARGVEAAARAGVRSVEHGYLSDDRAIEAMLEHGTVLVPTLSTLLRTLSADAPPWAARKRARLAAEGAERIAAAVAAGVPVAMGTDAGIVSHGTNLAELARLVDVGLSPELAIAAGTSVAADLCGVGDDVGTVTAGKRADLVLVDGDPLTDLTVLTTPGSISLVVQAGAIVGGADDA